MEKESFEQFVKNTFPHVLKTEVHHRVMKVLSLSYGKQSGILLQTSRRTEMTTIFVDYVVQYRLKMNLPCLLYVSEPLTYKRRFKALYGLSLNLEKIQSVDNPIYKVTLE